MPKDSMAKLVRQKMDELASIQKREFERAQPYEPSLSIQKREFEPAEAQSLQPATPRQSALRQPGQEPSQRSKDYDGPMAVAVKMAADFRGLADDDKRAFLEEVGKMFPLPDGITKGLPFKFEYIPTEKDGE